MTEVKWIKQPRIPNINYRLRECCFTVPDSPIYDDLREKARLPKEKNLLKGLCIVWNEDMELERAEIPMFLSSNTRRATEWRRERGGKGKGPYCAGWKKTNVRKYWQGDVWNFCGPIITRFLRRDGNKMIKSDGSESWIKLERVNFYSVRLVSSINSLFKLLL